MMDRIAITAAAVERLSPEHAALFVSHIRDAIAFSSTGEPVSGSRLGGEAVVAIDEWPVWNDMPLSFLACVDLADLHGFQTNLDLPPDGTLSFFYIVDDEAQPWGLYPEDMGGWRVVHTAAGQGRPLPAPEHAVVFTEVALTPRHSVTAPGFEEDVIRPIWDQRSELIALSEEVQPPGAGMGGNHQIGGWPLLQQGPFWDEAQFGLNEVPYNKRRNNPDPAVTALAETVGDWQLLFQLDSSSAAGWMWGDGGTLYFSIRKQDLAARRFDRCWLSLQCG